MDKSHYHDNKKNYPKQKRWKLESEEGRRPPPPSQYEKWESERLFSSPPQ